MGVKEERGRLLVDARHVNFVEDDKRGEGDEGVGTVDDLVKAEDDGELLMAGPEHLGVADREDEEGHGVVDKLES